MFSKQKISKKKIVLQVAYLVLLTITQNFLQYIEYNLLRKYYIIELIN